MKTITKGRHKGQIQDNDYLPAGPVRVRTRTLRPNPPPIIVSQFSVSVPHHERRSGYLYDWHSGMSYGLASDELKAAHRAGVPFSRIVAGVKQLVEIHP